MKPGQLYSRRELATALGMETSTMAARMNALIADKRCEVSGHFKCPILGRTVESVKLVAKQLELSV